MQILGIDFTSRPSKRKPLTCSLCTMLDGVLRTTSFIEWPDYEGFEAALAKPGPWIAGIDFPFGQSRRFIQNIDWPPSWAGYVRHAEKLGRSGFRQTLNTYKEARAPGDKEHRRLTDQAARSISPQKLFGVPVGLMFFEGAPRLLSSGITIPHVLPGDPNRIAIEAYPGVIARQFIGRRSYKSDTRKRQTSDQHVARCELLRSLRENAFKHYGFSIDAPDSLCDDPSADHLDAFLCAVQAAWSWTQRDNRYGAPEKVDHLEGWIADPHLSNYEASLTNPADNA
jgi:Protein of unknown function (DUF429)